MTYTELKTGDILPSWNLTTLTGEPAPTLESLRGQPVLIMFWNLGCPGCKSRASSHQTNERAVSRPSSHRGAYASEKVIPPPSEGNAVTT